MTREPEANSIDPRVHAYLDGDLSPSESAAFEGDLRAGSADRSRLETLEHLGSWLQATRPRAPSSLLPQVVSFIEDEASAAHPPGLSAEPEKRSIQAWFRFRWAWMPAAAALALYVVITSIPQNRVSDPSGGVDTASEHAAPVTVSPSPAGENQVRYVFTLSAAGAKEVCLAGDFNQWRVCEAPLERVGEDLWSIAVDLPHGRYAYMFVIDGHWVTDPQAMGYTDDGFGNQNALLII